MCWMFSGLYLQCVQLSSVSMFKLFFLTHVKIISLRVKKNSFWQVGKGQDWISRIRRLLDQVKYFLVKICYDWVELTNRVYKSLVLVLFHWLSVLLSNKYISSTVWRNKNIFTAPGVPRNSALLFLKPFLPSSSRSSFHWFPLKVA